MIKNQWVGWLVLLSILLSSCSRQREAPRRDLTEEEVMQVILDHNVDFDWWAAKGKISLHSTEQSGKGKLYLRMKKDSLIWAVGKKASLEGVRMNATPIDVYVKYPIDKVYQHGSFRQLQRQFDIELTFEDVQQLLAGNVFLPDPMSTQIARLEEGYQAIWEDDYGYHIEYLVDDRSSTLRRVVVTDAAGRRVSQTFEDYKAVEGSIAKVPFKRYIELDKETHLTMRLSEIEINVKKNTPFSINDRYTQISF